MDDADGSAAIEEDRDEESAAGELVGELPELLGTRWHGRHARRRALRLGCLGLLLAACAGLGTLGYALHSGSVTIHMLGGNTLKIGSSDFVLANSSFQDGTTYFVDLDGNGVRNILQLDYLSQTRSLELVLHYASRSAEGDHSLATLQLP